MVPLFLLLQVMNVKKFLQKVHSGSGDPNSPRPLRLFPDVFMEVGDIVWQLCDDPFEVKLRANYEVLCDYVQTATWCCMVMFSECLTIWPT